MKKLILILAAGLYTICLNAQLLSVPPTMSSDLANESNSSNLKITKNFRAEKQLARISLGETLYQIAVIKGQKKIILSTLNVNPSFKFSIEDEMGRVLVSDKINSNIIRQYNAKDLDDGVYTITFTGGGITSKRNFTITKTQISLDEDVALTSISAK